MRFGVGVRFSNTGQLILPQAPAIISTRGSGLIHGRASPSGLIKAGFRTRALISTSGGFTDNQEPSLLNRPTITSGNPTTSGAVLTWVGPSGGGANNGSPVQQTVTLPGPTSGQTISASGTYTGLNLSDTLTITASNVTVRQSYISSSGGASIVAINATGIANVIIEDCEIVGGGSGSGVTGQNGVFINNNTGSGIIIRRNNIYNSGNGVAVGDAPYTVVNNYIHDLAGAAATHFNGIEDNGHTNHDGAAVLIQYNAINNNLQDQTDALMLCNLGDLTNVTVDSNWLLGAGLTSAGVVYVDGSLGSGPISVTFTNNIVGPNVSTNYVFARPGTASSFTLTHTGNTSATTGLNIDGTF